MTVVKGTLVVRFINRNLFQYFNLILYYFSNATVLNGKTFPFEINQISEQQITDDNYDPYLHRKVGHPLT